MAHTETAPKGPMVTPPAGTDAYMDMASRRAAFRGFGMLTTWLCMLIFLTVGYATFTLTMHVPWIGAMVGFAVFGILAGIVMNMGGAWIATVIGLCVLGVFIQAMIWLGSVLLPH